MTLVARHPDTLPASSRLARMARRPVLRMAARRILQMIPVLLGITFVTFTLLNVLPGGPAVAILGDGATPESIAALETRLGLDRPFFVRYFDWLGHALTGDLGKSLASGQPVVEMIGSRIPVTLELILLALVFSLLLAVPVAVLAARRPHGIADRLSMTASMIGLSMPGFVFALLLVLVFAVNLRWLPAIGYVAPGVDLGRNLRTMILPVATITLTLFCQYVRVLRADIVDQMLTGDYVVTARAKGVSELRILTDHALRNSLFGTLTLVGLNLGTLIGGTVITEQIFALPGIGRELINSIMLRDVIVVEAIVSTLAVTVVVANFVTDMLYTVLDPRIRLGKVEA
jgi:peptide/nickel transport system permease protein